jgi:hypothetical protein
MVASNNARAAKARAPTGKITSSAGTGSQQRKAPTPTAPSQPKATPQPVNSRGPPSKKAPGPVPAPEPVSEEESEFDWEDDEKADDKGQHGPAEAHPTSHGPGIVVKIVGLAAASGELSQMPITNLEFAR